MDNITLRAALGLESSQWNAAGQLTIPLRKIHMLSYMEDEDLTYKWIAREFYRILFRPFAKSLVDNKRRCAWYFSFDRDVRLDFLSIDAFVTSTDEMTASGS